MFMWGCSWQNYWGSSGWYVSSLQAKSLSLKQNTLSSVLLWPYFLMCTWCLITLVLVSSSFFCNESLSCVTVSMSSLCLDSKFFNFDCVSFSNFVVSSSSNLFSYREIDRETYNKIILQSNKHWILFHETGYKDSRVIES